jgi:hypothetical protein
MSASEFKPKMSTPRCEGRLPRCRRIFELLLNLKISAIQSDSKRCQPGCAKSEFSGFSKEVCYLSSPKTRKRQDQHELARKIATVDAPLDEEEDRMDSDATAAVKVIPSVRERYEP